MTRALATATPMTPVNQVATMMRDLNIGDVLVLDDGKLCGIVTDRDLTINVLTNGSNPEAPIERYMTTDVVTGAPDWTLEQLAKTMGEHQVRRLPIVENDKVIGIVSLGDVAVHTARRETVGESLREISEATRTRFQAANPLTRVIALAIPLALGAALVIFANSNSGKRVRKQLSESDLADQARHTVTDAVQLLQDPKTRQVAFDALEATGLPEKTRQVIQEGVRTLQTSQARANQMTSDWSREGGRVSEYAKHVAGQAREQAYKQASQLPQEVTRRLQKSKPKRFIFA